MKKPALIIGAVIVCAGIVALVRLINVVGHSGGEGRWIESPDKKFLADAMSFEGEKFWGGKFTYYKFTIKTSRGTSICHYKLDNPPQPLSNWREEGEQLIQWTTDSSSVTYNFNGGHLTLSVNP